MAHIDLDLEPFARLLHQRTGLDIAHTEREKVKRLLQKRLHILNIDSLNNYCLFLTENSLQSELEWQKLIDNITVLESFFLRDKGQFKLLIEQIFPDLISRNQHKKSLKIWSAGCSTGEEPYSLALILQALLPDYQQWDILILGTDINCQALEKAKEGVYSQWSLRGVEEQYLKHFIPEKKLMRLDESVKKMVTFKQINLLASRFPNAEIYDIDLILCRNVFIYFSFEAISKVVKKFTKTLNDKGYLITGHGELFQQSLEGLKTLTYLESIIYQRCSRSEEILENRRSLKNSISKPSQNLQLTVENRTTKNTVFKEQAHEKILTDAESFINFYRQGQYQQIIKIAQQQIEINSRQFLNYYWAAKAYANLGEYLKAENYLNKSLEINQFSYESYYLLAHLKELQQDILQAKMFLQKVLYLNEAFIPAYLDLAMIFDKENNQTKAKKMRSNALNLLKQRSEEEYIEECDAKVGDIIVHLEKDF